MSGLISPSEFLYEGDTRGSAGIRWGSWIRDFEIYLTAAGVTKAAQRKATLLHVVGKVAREIYYSMAQNGDTYDDVKTRLTNHFTPFRNVDFEIYKFGLIKQGEQEAFNDFMVRLRESASRCDFNDTVPHIKRQIIAGCKSVKLKEHVLGTPGITIDQIVQKARTEEVVADQARLIHKQNNTQDRNESIAATGKQQTIKRHTAEGGKYYRSNNNTNSNRRCFSCGYDYPHKGECPAKERKCKVCNEKCHFSVSKFCKKRINTIEKHKEQNSEDEEDNFSDNGRLMDEHGTHEYLFTINSSDTRPFCKINIRNNSVRILIDSGAGSNIINEKTFNQMRNAPTLNKVKLKIYAFNSNIEIPVLGGFEETIELEGKTCKDEFLVVKGAPGNLLSFKTARLLDAFSLDIFKQMEIGSCCNINGGYEELMREFNTVFTDTVGCLKDCKVRLEINPEIRPVIQPYRRPPYHLAEATEKAIDELIRDDVVEKAPEPITWLSQLVIVPKEKKPNEVRLTVDSRLANRAIIRQKFVTPTLEEIKYDLRDATIFSELDCVKAFHQIELADEESKNITTFESSRGPLRFKRLHMGVHCASEKFQSKIREALKG